MRTKEQGLRIKQKETDAVSKPVKVNFYSNQLFSLYSNKEGIKKNNLKLFNNWNQQNK